MDLSKRELEKLVMKLSDISGLSVDELQESILEEDNYAGLSSNEIIKKELEFTKELSALAIKHGKDPIGVIVTVLSEFFAEASAKKGSTNPRTEFELYRRRARAITRDMLENFKIESIEEGIALLLFSVTTFVNECSHDFEEKQEAELDEILRSFFEI